MKKCQLAKTIARNTKDTNPAYKCKHVLDATGEILYIGEHLCNKCTEVFKEHIVKIANKNSKSRASSTSPSKELSIVELGLNFAKAAVKFALDGFKLVSKQEYVERTICCNTCSPYNSCPFCGCVIEIKARMNSEQGCPNKETYPNLSEYPSRNYWQVCNEITSVIIPARNEKYINRTIKSLFKNATGKIEVIVILDGYNQKIDNKDVKVLTFDTPIGKRASVNAGVVKATGKYLFFIDAHCTMSEGWDTKLKYACGEKDLVISSIVPIHEDSWKRKSKSGLYQHVYINSSLEEKWWNKSVNSKGSPIEETMAFTACGWMIEKAYFDSLGGHDDLSLGHWGHQGSEWALKVWLDESNQGRLLLRHDVICGHLFNTNINNNLYSAKIISQKEFRNKMSAKYGNKIQKLLDKFNPPGWEKDPLDPSDVIIKTQKVVETVIKDSATGKVLARRVIKGITFVNGTVRESDWKMLKEVLDKFKPKKVLEFGCGLSTQLFSQYGVQLTSYESNINWLNKTKDLVENVDLRLWDGKTIFTPGSGYDMAFIDGPFGGINREPSYASVAKSGIDLVVCHDSKRKEDKKWIHKYFKDWNIVFENNKSTGMVVLRRPK